MMLKTVKTPFGWEVGTYNANEGVIELETGSPVYATQQEAKQAMMQQQVASLYADDLPSIEYWGA